MNLDSAQCHKSSLCAAYISTLKRKVSQVIITRWRWQCKQDHTDVSILSIAW